MPAPAVRVGFIQRSERNGKFHTEITEYTEVGADRKVHTEITERTEINKFSGTAASFPQNSVFSVPSV